MPRALNGRLVVGLGSTAVVLAAWQLLVSTGSVNSDLLSSPAQVGLAGWDLVTSGELATHGLVSLYNLAVGSSVAAVLGIPLGLLMGRVKVVHELLGPPISALYALPYLALIPLIIVALGTGMLGHGAIIFLGAFIPIVINAQAGARDIDPLLLRAAKSFCAGRITTFFKVIVPATAGAIVTGMSLGLGRAVLAVVVGELFASTKGIGNLINKYGLNLDLPYLYFLVVFVGIISFILTRALNAVAPFFGYEQGGHR